MQHTKQIEYKPVTGRLESWTRDKLRSILWGDLFDDVHKRWCPGQHIHTSFIEGVRDMDLQEGCVIETLNSSYKLGKKGVDITH